MIPAGAVPESPPNKNKDVDDDVVLRCEWL